MKPEMFEPLEEVLNSCTKKMIEDFNTRILDEGSGVGGLLTVLHDFNFDDLMMEYGGPLLEAVEKQFVYQMSCEILGVTSMIVFDTSNSETSEPGSKKSIIDVDEIESLTHENECNNNNASLGITNTHIIFSN